MVKKIVEQFGGEVSVDSEVGRGSTFRLSFVLDEQESGGNDNSRMINHRFPRRRNQLKIKRIESSSDSE